MYSTCSICKGVLLVKGELSFCFKCQAYKGRPVEAPKYFELTHALEASPAEEPVFGKYKIKLLDRTLSGFKPGNLVILSGKSGMGKTLVATHITIRAALQGLTTFYLTTDMPVSKLLQRFRAGVGAGTQYDQMQHVKDKIFFLDLISRSWTSSQVMEHFGMILSKNNIECNLIVIDDLDSFGEEDTEGGIRYHQVGKMLNFFRHLADVLGCHVIAISQLNQLGDLSESQRKRHKADAVIEVSLPQGSTELTLTLKKNRDGSLGDAKYNVRYDYMCLEES